MPDSTDSVLSLAAQIVAAHVANNRVDPADLPKLINDVHRALANAGQSTAAPPRAEPAVDIKRSVRNDHIVCLECGKHFSMLKRHLNTDHQLTPGEYRQKWGLPPTYPVVAPDYAKTRSALARRSALGARGVKEEGWEEIGPIVSTSERGGQEGQTFIHPVIDTALIVGKLLVAMRDTKLVQRPHKPAGAVQQVELVAFTAIDKSAFRLRRLLPSVSTATTGS